MNFKVLQLTDLHLGGGFLSKAADEAAKGAARKVVAEAKPDLIIVTGDAMYSIPFKTGTRNNMRAAKVFCALMEEFCLPWAFTFGNHDYEPFTKYSKDKIGDYLMSRPHCLYQKGDYVLPVLGKGGKRIASIFCMDSNTKKYGILPADYDNIHDEQVIWYENEVNSAPSFMFCHIPLAEYRDAWAEAKAGKAKLHFGGAGESISAPSEGGKIFDAILAEKSTKAVFCGHDHLNDFSVTYKGVRLTFGMTMDHLAYLSRKKTYKTRGGTLLLIDDYGNFDIRQVPLSL